MNNSNNNQGGFIRTIVLILIMITILVYFGDDLKKLLEGEEAKEVIKKLVDLIRYLWDNFIKEPLMWFWDRVVIDILWEMIIKNAIDKLKDMKFE